MESANTHNPELQRLRAIAVIMITFSHGYFVYITPPILQNPMSGVDIFFVISGFVVTLSLLRLLPKYEAHETFIERLHKSRQAIEQFFIKRAFRLVPLALLWIVIPWGLSFAYAGHGDGHFFGTPEEVGTEVVAILAGFNGYLAPRYITEHLGYYWSLCAEVQFYLVLPYLFVRYVNKDSRLMFIVKCVIFFLIGILIAKAIINNPFVHDIYKMRYFSLFAGVAIALLYKKVQPATQPVVDDGFVKVMKFVIPVLILTLLWILPGIIPTLLPTDIGEIPLFTLATILVALAARQTGWILNVPILKQILEYIGSRSYAIYLSHFVILRLLLQNNYPGTLSVIDYLFAWFVVLLVCEICYRLLEKPMIKLGNNLIKKNYTLPAVYREEILPSPFIAAEVLPVTVVEIRAS